MCLRMADYYSHGSQRIICLKIIVLQPTWLCMILVKLHGQNQQILIIQQ